MSDLIDRQAAIAAADRADYTGFVVEDVKTVTDEVVKELKLLPSAQLEIIRCKDCKYADPFGHCDYVNFWNGVTDYCSRAERRTDE